MSEFYTTKEVAEKLKITEKKVRDYILQGRLNAVSLNGVPKNKKGPRMLRVSQADLDQFIQENTVNSTEETA